MKQQQCTITNQSLFDATYLHLRSQGRKSTNSHGMCLYRGPEETKCAVGFHITDAEYKKEMEINGVGHLIQRRLLPIRLIPHENLLIRLQSAHDGWDDTVDNLRNRFRLVAEEMHLSTTVLAV